MSRQMQWMPCPAMAGPDLPLAPFPGSPGFSGSTWLQRPLRSSLAHNAWVMALVMDAQMDTLGCLAGIRSELFAPFPPAPIFRYSQIMFDVYVKLLYINPMII